MKNPVLKTTERVLAWCVARQDRRGVPVDGPMTWCKVKALYKEVARKTNEMDPTEFKPARGWSFNLMKCHSLRNKCWEKWQVLMY